MQKAQTTNDVVGGEGWRVAGLFQGCATDCVCGYRDVVKLVARSWNCLQVVGKILNMHTRHIDTSG